jgi:hypothetical protein
VKPSLKFMNLRSRWKYKIQASPDQCSRAFIEAFSGSGGLIVKANWSVSRSGSGAVAVYQGRAGIGAIGGLLNGRSAAEGDSAVGSEVHFEIEGAEEGRTSCVMRVGSRGSVMGFTADARFFRPYLRAVEVELTRLDPSIEMT